MSEKSIDSDCLDIALRYTDEKGVLLETALLILMIEEVRLLRKEVKELKNKLDNTQTLQL